MKQIHFQRGADSDEVLNRRCFPRVSITSRSCWICRLSTCLGFFLLVHLLLALTSSRAQTVESGQTETPSPCMAKAGAEVQRRLYSADAGELRRALVMIRVPAKKILSPGLLLEALLTALELPEASLRSLSYTNAVLSITAAQAELDCIGAVLSSVPDSTGPKPLISKSTSNNPSSALISAKLRAAKYLYEYACFTEAQQDLEDVLVAEPGNVVAAYWLYQVQQCSEASALGHALFPTFPPQPAKPRTR